jgi:hypothetical protein
MAINDCKRLPVGSFLEGGSQPHQLILDEKRNNFGEVHLFLFAIGKSGRAFLVDQRRASL